MKTLLIILIMTISTAACADFAQMMGGTPRSGQSTVLRVDGREYVVRDGDTLADIAKKHSLTPRELAQANSMDENDAIVAGDKLLIPTVKKRVKPTKEDKKKEREEKRAAAKSKSKSGEKKKAPSAKNVDPDLAPENPAEADEPKSKYIWPVDGIVTSLMGPRRGRAHDGIDVSAPLGTPIVAIRQGTVIFAGKMSGYGNLVIIKHPSNIFSAYAHMSEMKVAKDDKVKQGTMIGKVGRTGRASATHLHFEMRQKTQVVDPMKYLPKRDPSTIRKNDNSED
jgi:murein DD-endopeptidase MepM/ murein hydrolase activator NlpD